MTIPVKPERSAAVSGRAAVAPESLDQWPAGFDRAALSALHRLTTGLAGHRTTEDLLTQFAECALALFQQGTHVSIHTTTDGHDAKPVVFDRHGDKLYMPIPRGIRNLVLNGKEAVSFVDSDANLSDSDSLQGADVRAGLCAPLLANDKNFGFVQIDCRGNMLGSFSQRDIEVLAVMTHQLALAMDNLRLQQELRGTIAELQRAKSDMEQLAFVDPLTELSNRRLFLDRLERSVVSARRAGSSVCLLYLDLDDFKQINDTLGHGMGDDLLRDISRRLSECVRGKDTVARIGGDEFAIVLDDVHRLYDILRVCEKVLESLSQPVQMGGREIAVSTSIGIAVATGAEAHPETMLKNADMALYKAKRQGRNSYQFFTEDLNQEVSERAFLENALRSALGAGQLRAVYQPVLELGSMRTTSVEALLRWRHPERGLIRPAEFVGLAEETGLIVPVGRWMLGTACHAVAQVPEVSVSVNLAARQVASSELLPNVREALAHSKLPPERLILEMTESTFMDARDVLPNLKSLRDRGVRIAIDDFGTGYSSLSYIKKFPADILKLDQSFIRGIGRITSDTEIASAVIAMAHKLNIKVVAEGIEKRMQLEFLKENHCDYGQGFLWGRPADLSTAIKPARTPGTKNHDSDVPPSEDTMDC